MSNEHLGTKHVCVSCAARFYDLMRAPATCPKCGTFQPVIPPRAVSSGGRGAAGRGYPRNMRAAPVVQATEEAEEVVVIDDDDDDLPEEVDADDDDDDAVVDVPIDRD